MIVITFAAAAQTCKLNPRFVVKAATCYNDGKIAYALLDKSNNVYTTLPPELNSVRIYYKVSETDSLHYNPTYYTGGWDTMLVAPGTYTIGIEALCSASTPELIYKEQTNVRVTSSYVPVSAALQTLEGENHENTVECADVGRVLVNLRQGRLPFTIWAEDTATHSVVRTLTYGSYPLGNTGNFSLDRLPAGTLLVKAEDACGTVAAVGSVEISTVSLPEVQYVAIPSYPQKRNRSSSRNYLDSNIVRVVLVFDEAEAPQIPRYLLKRLESFAEYRFSIDGLPSNDWKKFRNYPF